MEILFNYIGNIYFSVSSETFKNILLIELLEIFPRKTCLINIFRKNLLEKHFSENINPEMYLIQNFDIIRESKLFSRIHLIFYLNINFP